MGALVSLLACSIPILFASPAETPPTSIKWAGHAFREVRTLGELPSALQTALGAGHPGLGGIADRDGRYNPIDALDSRLPSRRFLVAGLDGDSALVAIEQGGIAVRVRVTLYSNVDRKATAQRTWTLVEVPRTLQALVDHLPPR